MFAQAAVGIFALMLFSFGTAVVTRYALVLPQLRELEALADRKDLRPVLLADQPCLCECRPRYADG